MRRKSIVFIIVVALICFLCITNSNYIVWKIGGFGDIEIGFLYVLSILLPLFTMLYLSFGLAPPNNNLFGPSRLLQKVYGRDFTNLNSTKFGRSYSKFLEKMRKHFMRLETKLNLSIKQIFVCGAISCVIVIASSLYIGYKFYNYYSYGDCLFNKSPGWSENKDISSLYTSDGRTIVNNKRYYLDFTKHEDCDISRNLLSIDGYRQKSCVIECPGGPYFCYLKKVDIDQVGKGRDYDYDKYDDRAYYQYEQYRISYLISIYNSEGRYVDDFETDDIFYYYPNKKKIDGEEYSYTVYGEDLEYSCYDELAKVVHEDLVDYVSSMNDEVQPSSKVPEVQPQSTPQPIPQSTPQPTPAPVPMQVFKKCWSCLGGGQCSTCYGSGSIYYPYPTGEQRCPVCGGTGRCNICAGRGGEYVVEYH